MFELLEQHEYNKLVKQTCKLVDLIHNRYENGNSVAYMYLLRGMDYCKVHSRRGQEHNYKAAIDAIHLYQKKHPDKKVKEAYFDTMCMLADVAKGQKSFDFVIDVINYELDKKKNGTNTFEIDSTEILYRLKVSIERFKDNYNYSEVINWYNVQKNNIDQKKK